MPNFYRPVKENINPAKDPPNNGPANGTHEYAQSLSLLPLIGRKKCTRRGARSRAGFIAYPVVPPKDIPIATIRIPTGKGPAI